MKTLLTVAALACATSFAAAGDVHPDVIFGSGNANGNFTVATNSGIELGLRAKRRYNSSGVPDGVTNFDGVDTYTFNPANGNAPANRAMWNFEWSVNTDVDGNSGTKLSGLTYAISLFKANADGTNPADAYTFDPINQAWTDNSIGDNTTGNGMGTEAAFADVITYQGLIANNNVAQNSWNYGFFNGAGTGPLEGMDPAALGTYIIRLTAFDASGLEVVSTDINVHVVPLPSAALAGLGMLGGIAGIRTLRRR
ncbi:MAG: PEP-CTERM sorting domain-containing protein [Phycisphaerales bacterium]